ncbi:MAG: shikimate dehydrogenase [Gallionella sp.]|nr:shikimate dehydrogenase [Gallionella sp.]
MTDKYAVIGNPVAHSKSPQIHKMFAEQTGQDISYEAILAPLDGFAATVARLRNEGFKGCNVTVPFKQEAWNLCLPTTRALDAQAANTLKFDAERIIGDNTDGIGLVNDIEKNLKISLKDKRILLIGAGGAARGVLHPLLESTQSPLVMKVIYNRTLEKAVSLKKTVEQHAEFRTFIIRAVEFGNLGNEQFDIVINATSAGLTDSEIPLPPNIFAPGALAYDMMYGRETPFMKFARVHGAAVVADGLGMLVEQAAEAFFIWRGVRPVTAPVIAALRQA